MYSQEVFDYCLKKHGVDPPQLQGCMLRQEGFRTDILERAHKQLGRRSLAEMLYYDCLDFYRGAPISKTVKCVETRLILRKRLNQPDAEAEIYRRCEVKWRKHSIRAVRNCSVSAASYFEDTGKYRD